MVVAITTTVEVGKQQPTRLPQDQATLPHPSSPHLLTHPPTHQQSYSPVAVLAFCNLPVLAQLRLVRTAEGIDYHPEVLLWFAETAAEMGGDELHRAVSAMLPAGFLEGVCMRTDVQRAE